MMRSFFTQILTIDTPELAREGVPGDVFCEYNLSDAYFVSVIVVPYAKIMICGTAL